jgi:hypothetical protein
MSDPKLHHYVPQFYLERFTNSNGRLWVFDKKLNRKFCSSPKSLAAETKFYYSSELAGTKYTPFFVEKQFSALESNASQITGDWLNQLNNCKSRDQLKISAFERSEMALFVALQYLRTAESRRLLKIFAEHNSEISEDELRNIHVRLICDSESVQNISRRIKQSVWIFAKNNTRRPFFTSDNPVTFMKSNSKVRKMWLKLPGILSPETCISLPLSPTIILYCERKSLTKKLKQFNNCLSPVEFKEDMVNHENSGQVFMSSRFVFAPTNDFEDVEIFWRRIQNETSPTVEEMLS